MITREEFVTELNNIIFDQNKKEKIEKDMSSYIEGFNFVIPDANEERAVRYLSALIGLGLGKDSPLMDWYYDPFRNGIYNQNFVIKTEDGTEKKLVSPEDFYDFYCGGGEDDKI